MLFFYAASFSRISKESSCMFTSHKFFVLRPISTPLVEHLQLQNSSQNFPLEHRGPSGSPFIFMILLAVQAVQAIRTIDLQGGLFLGYYYLTLYVGTPPLPRSLIFDTGSGMFAMPCSLCQLCGKHMHQAFPALSSSFKPITCQQNTSCICSREFPNKCQFSLTYAQGSSIRGFLFKQKVILSREEYQIFLKGDRKIEQDNSNSITATIGCITNQTKLFFDQLADGILGFNNYDSSSFINQLFKQGAHRLWAICLHFQGGFITLDQDMDKYDFGPTSEITLVKGQNIMARLTGVSIGNQTSKANQNVIFDTGSTFTSLSFQWYESLRVIIRKTCLNGWTQCKQKQQNGDACFQITADNNYNQKLLLQFIDSLPSMTFQFGEGRIEWLPEQYLYRLRNNTFCIAASKRHQVLLGMTGLRHKKLLLKEESMLVRKSSCGRSFRSNFSEYYFV